MRCSGVANSSEGVKPAQIAGGGAKQALGCSLAERQNMGSPPVAKRRRRFGLGLGLALLLAAASTKTKCTGRSTEALCSRLWTTPTGRLAAMAPSDTRAVEMNGMCHSTTPAPSEDFEMTRNENVSFGTYSVMRQISFLFDGEEGERTGGDAMDIDPDSRPPPLSLLPPSLPPSPVGIGDVSSSPSPGAESSGIDVELESSPPVQPPAPPLRAMLAAAG